MLFHLFAFSILATFTCFISGYVCEKNALAELTNVLFLGGTVFLSLTYVSVFLALSLCCLKEAAIGIRQYFSRTEAAKRKVLFSQGRLRDLERRHRVEKLQIHYQNVNQRKNLFRTNNKKHIRSLSNSIAENLISVQDKIPAGTYKSLKKVSRQYYRTENVEGLLKLHFEIISFR